MYHFGWWKYILFNLVAPKGLYLICLFLPGCLAPTESNAALQHSHKVAENRSHILRWFLCRWCVSLNSRCPRWISKDSLTEYQFICKIKVITMKCNITLLCILYTCVRCFALLQGMCVHDHSLSRIAKKLMQIELSNRECAFLPLILIPRLRTNVVIACYMISVKHDARCITLDWKTTIK